MMITIKQAAKPLGLSPGTARNRASKGNFPVPLVRQGTSDARVRLVDLAKYLAGETVAKKGRPTKAEQIARRYKEVSHGH